MKLKSLFFHHLISLQVTVVGKQSGREIRPFETETGEELLFLYPGMRKPDEVFDYEHAQNRLQTWIYRLLGWFAMFLGFNCVSNLLDIIGKHLFLVQL